MTEIVVTLADNVSDYITDYGMIYLDKNNTI